MTEKQSVGQKALHQDDVVEVGDATTSSTDVEEEWWREKSREGNPIPKDEYGNSVWDSWGVAHLGLTRLESGNIDVVLGYESYNRNGMETDEEQGWLLAELQEIVTRVRANEASDEEIQKLFLEAHRLRQKPSSFGVSDDEVRAWRERARQAVVIAHEQRIVSWVVGENYDPLIGGSYNPLLDYPFPSVYSVNLDDLSFSENELAFFIRDGERIDRLHHADVARRDLALYRSNQDFSALRRVLMSGCRPSELGLTTEEWQRLEMEVEHAENVAAAQGMLERCRRSAWFYPELERLLEHVSIEELETTQEEIDTFEHSANVLAAQSYVKMVRLYPEAIPRLLEYLDRGVSHEEAGITEDEVQKLFAAAIEE